jgi:hypothetical protein
LSQQVSSHSIQIAQICMQQKKEERRQAEDTTTSFLRSKGTAGIYQYSPENDDLDKILAGFIDVDTGACLECGQVHNNSIRIGTRRRGWRKNDSPYLDRLFWDEVPI